MSKYGILVDLEIKSTTRDFHKLLSGDLGEATNHLVYADYLEENGKPTHAEIIRNHFVRGHNKDRGTAEPYQYPREHEVGEGEDQFSPDTVHELFGQDIKPGEFRHKLHNLASYKHHPDLVTLEHRDETDPDRQFTYFADYPVGKGKAVLDKLANEGSFVKHPKKPEELRENKVEVKARKEVTPEEAHTSTRNAFNASNRLGAAVNPAQRAREASESRHHQDALLEHVSSAIIHGWHQDDHDMYFARGELHQDNTAGVPLIGEGSHKHAKELHYTAARNHENILGNYVLLPSAEAHELSTQTGGQPNEQERGAAARAIGHASQGNYAKALKALTIGAGYHKKNLGGYYGQEHRAALDAHRKGIAANAAMLHFPGYLQHEGHEALNDHNFLGAVADKTEESGNESAARHIRELFRPHETKSIDDKKGIIIKGEDEIKKARELSKKAAESAPDSAASRLAYMHVEEQQPRHAISRHLEYDKLFDGNEYAQESRELHRNAATALANAYGEHAIIPSLEAAHLSERTSRLGQASVDAKYHALEGNNEKALNSHKKSVEYHESNDKSPEGFYSERHRAAAIAHREAIGAHAKMIHGLHPDTPHAIAADYIEERGDPDTASYVRKLDEHPAGAVKAVDGEPVDESVRIVKSHEAFQKAIKENPGDKNVRGAYADYLEEHEDNISQESLNHLRHHIGHIQVTQSDTGIEVGPAPKRYQVSERSAPATSGAGRYRRPVHIRVYDTHAPGTEWHWSRGQNGGLVNAWLNVDSRYTGRRSAYGQAREEAHALAKRLNDEHEGFIPESKETKSIDDRYGILVDLEV